MVCDAAQLRCLERYGVFVFQIVDYQNVHWTVNNKKCLFHMGLSNSEVNYPNINEGMWGLITNLMLITCLG